MEEGYRDRSDSGRRRVLIHVICELSSQTKVKLAQLFGTGVSVPYGC